MMDSKLFSEPQTAEVLLQLSSFNAFDDITLSAVHDTKINGFGIERQGTKITVRYSQRVYFYRALGVICEQSGDQYHIMQTARFEMNGILTDCSRNAVPHAETVKKLIRHMALMGMNTLMLYTEDTYEIPQEPYFGYMRGHYKRQELQEIDAYAESFGITMVPCIQTLAHLNAAFRWPQYESVIDTQDILLLDDQQSYDLIERMIASCRNAFKTSKIHVGMDEAQMLGRGRYYDNHGDSNRFELMNRHLKKVLEICKKYNFEPMIWSDMYFRLANHGEYEGPDPVPEEVASKIPADVSLVYWDYYQNDYAAYEKMIKLHAALPGRTVFAGGVWKWMGYLPLLRLSMERTKTALTACVNNAVRDVFTTAWGDNGAEAGLFTILPALQAQAEWSFHKDVDEEHLRQRLKTCTGAEFADFLLLDMPEMPFGGDNDLYNPHKYLLYQDVLMGLFDRHVPEGTAGKYAE